MTAVTADTHPFEVGTTLYEDNENVLKAETPSGAYVVLGTHATATMRRWEITIDEPTGLGEHQQQYRRGTGKEGSRIVLRSAPDAFETFFFLVADRGGDVAAPSTAQLDPGEELTSEQVANDCEIRLVRHRNPDVDGFEILVSSDDWLLEGEIVVATAEDWAEAQRLFYRQLFAEQ